jgi:hypothetical protein
LFALEFFHPDCSSIVYQDDGKKHQDVLWNESHIEVATTGKNEQPAKTLRQ